MSSFNFNRGIGRTPKDDVRTRRAIQRLRQKQLRAGPGLNLSENGTISVDLDELIVTNERPSGAIDGMNDTFVLAETAIQGTVQVFLNGVFMADSGDDYNLVSGSQIVFVSNQIPQSGDRLVAHYRVSV